MRNRNTALLATLASLSFTTAGARADGTQSFRYVADFICGNNPGALPRVVPGFYATTIAIFNGGGSAAAIEADVAFSFPANGGVLNLSVLPSIPAGGVASVDCGTIQSAATFPSPPYFQGLVVITSSRSLDVARSLTASEASGGGITATDADRIPERRFDRDKD